MVLEEGLINASIFNSIQHTGRKSTTQGQVSCKPKFKLKARTIQKVMPVLIVHLTESYFPYICTDHKVAGCLCC